MKLFRITDPRFAESADLRDHARGSLVVSGRWHDPQSMLPDGGLLYTSASASLCSTEKQVHIAPEQLRHHEFALITYEATIDPDLTTVLTADELPADWNDPLGCETCLRAGSEWYQEGSSVFLIVPSVTLPASAYDPDPPEAMRNGNVLVNTRHPQAAGLIRKTQVASFKYDSRLAP
jgi:RES domain-containing protein